MAAEAQAAFPPPPAYYLLFRDGPGPDPPAPITDDYHCYGEASNIGSRIQHASGSHVPQSALGGRAELRQLGRELGILILELVDSLVERPSSFARRVEDISLVFKDIYHRLGELRPQQARLTILHLLQTQLELRRQALADIREQRGLVQAMINKAREDLKASLIGPMNTAVDTE